MKLMAPGPLPDMTLGQADGAGDDRRICLDDLPALRQFLPHRLRHAEDEIYRHRQGLFRVPRVSARPARLRRLDGGALRAEGQVFPDRQHAVPQPGQLGLRQQARAGAGRPAQALRLRPGLLRRLPEEDRYRQGHQRRSRSTARRSSASTARRPSSSTARSSRRDGCRGRWRRSSNPLLAKAKSQPAN